MSKSNRVTTIEPETETKNLLLPEKPFGEWGQPDLTLISGANVILVAQNKGGQGKSMAALETYVSCIYSGIPAILATLDGSNETLENALTRKSPKDLSETEPSRVLQLDISDMRGFHDALDAADTAGAVLIVDTPPGFVDGSHPLIESFKRSRVFSGENSISAIIPVTPDQDAIKGALQALSVMPVKFRRCLIRAWRHKEHAPAWKDFPMWQPLLDQTQCPIWFLGMWLSSTQDLIHRQREFEAFPPVDLIPDYYATTGMEHPRHARKALEATIAHFEEARAQIFKHLLEPLIVK